MSKQVAIIDVKAQDGASKVFNKINASLARLEKTANKKTGGGLGGIGNAAAAIGGAATLTSIANISDKMVGLKARFADVFGSVDAGSVAFDKSFDAAQKVGIEFDAFASTVARLAPAYKEIGRSQDDAIAATSTMTSMLKLYGATSAEAASTSLQFAQAMGSGKLAGDELKAMAESNAPFMRVLAKELGVNVGQLKDLGADGKITAKIMSSVLAKSFDEFDKKIRNQPQTFGTTFTRLGNLWGKFLLKIQETGAFKSIFDALGMVMDKFSAFISDGSKMEALGNAIKKAFDFAPIVLSTFAAFKTFEAVSGIMTIAATGITGKLVPALAGAWMWTRKLIVSTTLVGALGGFTTLGGAANMAKGAVAGLTGGVRVLFAAMLANPIGLIIGAIAAFAAVVVMCYTKSEPLRTAVSGLWDVMGRLAAQFGITGSFGENFGAVLTYIGDRAAVVIGFIADTIQAVSDLIGTAKAFATGGEYKVTTGLFDNTKAAYNSMGQGSAPKASATTVAPAAAAAVSPAMQQAATAQTAAAQTNTQAAAANVKAATDGAANAAKDAQTTNAFAAAVSNLQSAASQMSAALSNINVNVNVSGQTMAAPRVALNMGGMV